MPPVRKLWIEKERLMTIRAWVSLMDLIETNNNLSHEELVKKMENYKMDHNRFICMNIEDIYGIFIHLMYKKMYIKYTNWDYYQRVFINSLHNDDKTLVFKARILKEIENPRTHIIC